MDLPLPLPGHREGILLPSNCPITHVPSLRPVLRSTQTHADSSSSLITARVRFVASLACRGIPGILKIRQAEGLCVFLRPEWPYWSQEAQERSKVAEKRLRQHENQTSL